MTKDTCDVNCINEEKVKRLKSVMIKEHFVNSTSDIFKILGDKTRIRILYALSKEELCVCDLANLIGMTESAVSHQLRLLRTYNMAKFRKEGKIVYYSLSDLHVVKLIEAGIKHAKE